jgi:hypothetical protein
MVELAVRFGSERQSVLFEVVSTKFGHERDFERMTQDIAAKCGQLLLQWNTPSGVPFTSDPERRRRLVLEQFLYLSQALGAGKLERWMESVRSNPHSALERESNWRPAGLARSGDFLRNPMAMARDFPILMPNAKCRLRGQSRRRPGCWSAGDRLVLLVRGGNRRGCQYHDILLFGCYFFLQSEGTPN